jgi:hypothetical protein
MPPTGGGGGLEGANRRFVTRRQAPSLPEIKPYGFAFGVCYAKLHEMLMEH